MFRKLKTAIIKSKVKRDCKKLLKQHEDWVRNFVTATKTSILIELLLQLLDLNISFKKKLELLLICTFPNVVMEEFLKENNRIDTWTSIKPDYQNWKSKYEFDHNAEKISDAIGLPENRLKEIAANHLSILSFFFTEPVSVLSAVLMDDTLIPLEKAYLLYLLTALELNISPFGTNKISL